MGGWAGGWKGGIELQLLATDWEVKGHPGSEAHWSAISPWRGAAGRGAAGRGAGGGSEGMCTSGGDRPAKIVVLGAQACNGGHGVIDGAVHLALRATIRRAPTLGLRERGFATIGTRCVGLQGLLERRHLAASTTDSDGRDTRSSVKEAGPDAEWVV